jgi:hypothetical protein
MKTEFSLTQLADPDIAVADKILRAATNSIARAAAST